MSFPPLRGFYHYKKIVSSHYFPFFSQKFVVNFQMQQDFLALVGRFFFSCIEGEPDYRM